MIAKLIVSPNLEIRSKEIAKILRQNNLDLNHPDLLQFTDEQKLGIEQALKISKHFAFKPHQALGKAAVIHSAQKLTLEAQNALLKTLEELPQHALILLGASSTDDLLPTLLSRCQIIKINSELLEDHQILLDKYQQDLTILTSASIQKRFEYIEKLKDKEEFLKFLVVAYHQKLQDPNGNLNQAKEFLKTLLEAQKWYKQNVNIRGILEYLMLVLESRV